ncbi:MAG: hypothetical protein NE328_16620 [Lentisphaeraceae bacterium]|nr:hypothetical protein [Lentisphaeraceae bacterium]
MRIIYAIKRNFRTITFAVSAIIIVLSLFHYLITGAFTPKAIIEELNNTRQVREITSNGLIMADGSLVKIRHISKLPKDSKTLREAIERGIEIDDKGNTFGLVKIWHWCGNDPVRYHLARVNLSSLVLLIGGTPSQEIPFELIGMHLPSDNSISYNEHGLNILFYQRMLLISESLKVTTKQL